MGFRPTRLPPLWPSLLLCAVVAVLVNLGPFHRLHNSDTLMPVLVSLYRWTPFFWMQDRVGMLVPLLASPIAHPFYNLLFHGWVHVFSGLAASFLMARYVLRDPSYPLVGGVCAAAFLALTPHYYQFEFFQNTFFGVWLALGAGGLVLAATELDAPPRRGRLVAALALFILAHWVFNSTLILLGPLVVCRALLMEPARRPWQGEAGITLALLGISFLVGCVLIGIPHINPPGSIHGMVVGINLPSTWPDVWGGLARSTWHVLQPPYWPRFLLAMAALGLLLNCLPALRHSAAHTVRAAGALAGAAIIYWLVIGTQYWMSLNFYNARYLQPAVFLLGIAMPLLALAPLGTLLERWHGRAVYLLLVPTLLLAALATYGLPAPDQVRADIGREFWPFRLQPGVLERCTARVVDGRCTHIAGDYWKVWPLMFNANLVLYERGEQRVVWGITSCSESTRDRWQRIAPEDMRIAVLADDPEAQQFLEEFELPQLEVVEKGPEIWILRPSKSAGQP